MKLLSVTPSSRTLVVEKDDWGASIGDTEGSITTGKADGGNDRSHDALTDVSTRPPLRPSGPGTAARRAPDTLAPTTPCAVRTVTGGTVATRRPATTKSTPPLAPALAVAPVKSVSNVDWAVLARRTKSSFTPVDVTE